MNIRQHTEELERKMLSPRAMLSSNSRGRERAEAPCQIRTAFQRDRDRIVHSKSFRRLKHKTQVFLAPAGDHYRTRLTHTLEVSQLARTIARALRLNEDLTEAISLGHDLGHTPFGHAGEEVLHSIVPGGFNHWEQSLRIVEVLENDGRGLNLTWEVREGIGRHSKGIGEIIPAKEEEKSETLEGRIVRLSDIIAYVNHDIDDACRAGVLEPSDIPAELRSSLGESHSERINRMVTDVIYSSMAMDLSDIIMSPPMLAATEKLRDFLHLTVYENRIPKAEFTKTEKIITELYNYLLKNPYKMPGKLSEKEPLKRIVCDFIAGMTDRYAIRLFEEIYIPKPWAII